jgi:hypothetical protein
VVLGMGGWICGASLRLAQPTLIQYCLTTDIPAVILTGSGPRIKKRGGEENFFFHECYMWILNKPSVFQEEKKFSLTGPQSF